MTVVTPRVAPVEWSRAGLAGRVFSHVIAGVSVPVVEGSAVLEVLDPATGGVITRIVAGGPGDVDRAVIAARAAFPAWRALTPAQRSGVLFAMADVVDAHLGELVALESFNVGKPIGLAAEEIPGVGEIFRYMGGAARALQAPATEEYTTGYLSMIRREPHGVIGAITPWNYPLMTASWKIAAALAMGNTMVLKPSELTPLTTLRFLDLIADVVPPGVLNVVLGTGPDVGAAIAAHPDIDLVSITGSIASGQHVMTGAAATLKPVHLELGGKAPVLVFADADLTAVARTVRTAGFVNTGQECGAATRILCHTSIADDLTRLLIDEVSAITTGAPTDGDTIDMGPLVSAAHRDRVHAMVTRAHTAGATIALGGTPTPGPGNFYPPTIITTPPPNAEITTHEIFGPVITIETFTDDTDALTQANNTPYGLAASIWTHNITRALHLTSALNFGTVWVNTHLTLTNEMPWAGYHASGHGRECSTLSLEDFSRTKHVMITTTD